MIRGVDTNLDLIDFSILGKLGEICLESNFTQRKVSETNAKKMQKRRQKALEGLAYLEIGFKVLGILCGIKLELIGVGCFHKR